jgi:hypothetical protein
LAFGILSESYATDSACWKNPAGTVSAYSEVWKCIMHLPQVHRYFIQLKKRYPDEHLSP